MAGSRARDCRAREGPDDPTGLCPTLGFVLVAGLSMLVLLGLRPFACRAVRGDLGQLLPPSPLPLCHETLPLFTHALRVRCTARHTVATHRHSRTSECCLLCCAWLQVASSSSARHTCATHLDVSAGVIPTLSRAERCGRGAFFLLHIHASSPNAAALK